MKKLILSSIALLAFVGSYAAQPKEAVAILKKIEKSDAEINDPKKGTVAKTWIDRASLFIDANSVYSSQLIVGFPVEQLKSTLGNPTLVEDVTFSTAALKKHKFEFVDVYTNPDGIIQIWNTTSSVVPNPLGKAEDALVKAKELAPKEFEAKGKGFAASEKLQNQFNTEAVAAYTLDLKKEAGEFFSRAYSAAALRGVIDTVSLYYSGITFFEAGDYGKAISSMEKMMSIGGEMDGMTAFYLGNALAQDGKIEEANKVFESGLTKYPNNSSLLGATINHFLTTNQSADKTVDIIHKAESLDPTNASLYLAEAVTWEKLGNSEKKYSCLDKALELDPSNFNVFYNYGVYKILDSEESRKAADKLDLNDIKGYNALIDQAVAQQLSAIEKLEKAHELNKTDATVVDFLRQLYFPRRDDPKFADRYAYFNKLHSELGGE